MEDMDGKMKAMGITAELKGLRKWLTKQWLMGNTDVVEETRK